MKIVPDSFSSMRLQMFSGGHYVSVTTVEEMVEDNRSSTSSALVS